MELFSNFEEGKIERFYDSKNISAHDFLRSAKKVNSMIFLDTYKINVLNIVIYSGEAKISDKKHTYNHVMIPLKDDLHESLNKVVGAFNLGV